MKTLLIFFYFIYLDTCFYAFPKIYTATDNEIPKYIDERLSPEFFIKIGSKFYYIEDIDKDNWIFANHMCRYRGAELASIENESEMLALSEYLIEKRYPSSKKFWISGNDLIEEGSFSWLGTGNKVDYFKWGPNNPSNSGNSENCMSLYTWGHANMYYMNDDDCAQNKHYICELNDMKFVTFAFFKA